ncbi:MAG: SusF/SusE family outer membrane protein [Paludibacter sp.]
MRTNLLSKLVAVTLFSLITFINVNAQNPMCIIGDATKYGWDKDKSSPLTQDGVNPSKFYFNAYLNAGSFKFLMQNSDWVPSWNKGASETQVVKRATYADADNSFSVTTAGNYAVVLDTAALTLSVTPMTETTPITFNTIFMVGDATPNSWDLGSATELTKNPTNPFEFSYTGALSVGEFKLPVNRNWGWNQDFFVKVSDTQMQLVAGGDVKWSITEAANYKVTINTNTLAISIEKQITALNPALENRQLSLKSNVVKDQLTVLSQNSADYLIFSIVGSLVQRGAITGSSINISNLRSGIYMVKIENKSFKFIKE